jgi:hypothetical protein
VFELNGQLFWFKNEIGDTLDCFFPTIKEGSGAFPKPNLSKFQSIWQG